MINIKTLLSSFDDKGTLMKWLKSVEHALDDATLTSVQVISTSDTTIKLSFVFADGTSIETPTITLPRGEQGETGVTGNGIASITKTGTSGLVDTYTITFTNGTTTTFTVTNGEDGQDGQDGATGATGATGNGIASITKTGTSGLVDTYTITFTNGTTTTFTVTNGQNGADGVGIPTGGTTGQVLKKKSNTNYDTEWTAESAGIGVVTYGTSTRADVDAIINDGRFPLCQEIYLGHTYWYMYYGDYMFYRSTHDGTKLVFVQSDGTWIDYESNFITNPMYAQGDTIYGGTDGIATRLAKGTAGQVLTMNTGATAPEWKNPQTGMVNPMSSLSDMIYGGADGVPVRLAKGTAGQVLTMNSGATAPEWQTPSGGGGGGSQLYIHNIYINAYLPSGEEYYVSTTIINSSQTEFTYNSLSNYLYTNGIYKSASGSYFDGTSTYSPVYLIGSLSNTYILFDIEAVTTGNTYREIDFDSIDFTDDVLTL